MRPLRRLAALLVQLLILQGALIGGWSACALSQPSAGRAAAERAHLGVHHGAHLGAQHASATQHDGEQQHRQQPLQQHAPSHCMAAGPCAAAAALGGHAVGLPASVEVAAGRADVAEFDAPRSIGTAPEPPPPRP